jgi:hypothetical protein
LLNLEHLQIIHEARRLLSDPRRRVKGTERVAMFVADFCGLDCQVALTSWACGRWKLIAEMIMVELRMLLGVTENGVLFGRVDIAAGGPRRGVVDII